MPLKPHQIVAFVFIFIITLALCTHLFAQESKPGLPAELKEKVDSLIQKLGDDKYTVREAAQREITGLLQDTKTFDALLSYLKQQMDTTNDVEVKVRLERIVKPYVEFGITSSLLEKFPDIITRLTSGDWEIRRKFVEELQDLKHPDAATLLIRTLRDKDGRVSDAAKRALVKIGDAAVELLLNLLSDADGNVRYQAVSALGRIRDVRAVEPLIKALVDADPNLRTCAADALGNIKDARAVEPLIRALGDAAPDVRLYAAVALGRIKDARAVEPLIKALGDGIPWMRLYAAAALGEIGHIRAVEPLITALRDEEYRVRDAAEEALGKIDKGALDSLKAAFEKETDEKIKERLKGIIEKITK